MMKRRRWLATEQLASLLGAVNLCFCRPNTTTEEANTSAKLKVLKLGVHKTIVGML